MGEDLCPLLQVDLSLLMSLLSPMPVLLIFPLRPPLMDTDLMDTAVALSDLDMPTQSARDPPMLMPMPTMDMVSDTPTLDIPTSDTPTSDMPTLDMLDTMVTPDLLLMPPLPEPALPVW